MRKQPVVKAECAGVFPFMGSPEEGRNKKIRTLKTVGFRLTPEQAVTTATALLTQAHVASKNGDKHAVLDVLARRKDGPSVLTVETASAPPERKKRVRVPKAKEDGQEAASSSASEKTTAPKKRKQPKSAPAEAHSQSTSSEAA